MLFGIARKRLGKFGSGDEPNSFISRFPTVTKFQYGCWNIINDHQIVKISANELDFVIIDLEHGFRDFQDFASAFEATRSTTAEIYVRVRKYNDPWIQALLDLGVTRFVVPQIRELRELNDFLHATTFPPDGRRGLHPRIFQSTGRRSTAIKDVPNLKVHTCVIIETKAALSLTEAICAHPRVDEIYIGVYDLSLELEMEGGTESKEMLDICSEISNVASKFSIPLMAMTTSKTGLKKLHSVGVSKFVIGIDSSILQESISDRASIFRESVDSDFA